MRAALIVMMAIWMAMMTLPNTGRAAEVIELKIGHLSAVGGVEDLAVNKIAEVAQQKSNGRIRVKVFPGAQLGNFVSQMEAVHSGRSGYGLGKPGLAG